MPVLYSLLGPDGQATPPVDLATLQSWINAGRVFRDQKVLRSDLKDWYRAGDYVEFTWPSPSPSAPTPAGPAPIDLGQLPAATPNPNPAAARETQRRSGATPAEVRPEDLQAVGSAASWLWTITALSAINFVSAAFRLGIVFPVGTSISFLCGVLSRSNPLGWLAGIFFVGLVAGLAYFCRRIQLWAFIVALVVLAGDTILVVLEQDWIGLAFHAWIVWSLVGGLVATYHLRRSLRPG